MTLHFHGPCQPVFEFRTRIHEAVKLEILVRSASGDLTPGQMYTIQMRALGGSTGRSNWSDSSTHMAM